jgi:uncharacterized damage-inducible protein DinB
MSTNEALLSEFDQEMANTRKVLERCPEEKFTWKPHQRSFDLVSLAHHVSDLPTWAVLIMDADSFDYAPPGAPPYKPNLPASSKDLLEHFDSGVSKARAAIAGATDEQLAAPWTLLAGGHNIFTMPRAAVLRSMVMNHGIHHRAQLTVYLRLNDVPVPGLYGPSADEQEASGAASAATE